MPTDLPTRDDYFNIGAEEILARSAERTRPSRISPEAVFTEGTDINIITAECSAMADEATRHLSMRMAAIFLDSAQGTDLDRLVSDRFSPTVVRKQASPSVVTVTFSRPIPPSTGAATTIPIGTRLRTTQGIEFETTQAVSFSLNSTGPVLSDAQATQAGTVGNTAAGLVNAFVSTPPDPTIVVTNAEPASGGADIESDPSLRSRARDFFRTVRRGTLAAIEFGALTVNGVSAATATEELDPFGKPTGRVGLQISDAQGNSNSVLAAAVVAAEREWRAAGIIVDIITSVPALVDISYIMAFRSGTDTSAAVQQLKAITVSAVNILAPGAPLLRSLLQSLARSIPGAIVTDTAVPIPAGDLYPAAGGVIKTDLSRVLVNGM
jgi:uncharacterized phage protein gp47/JayE